jgi:hypothetical protein
MFLSFIDIFLDFIPFDRVAGLDEFEGLVALSLGVRVPQELM